MQKLLLLKGKTSDVGQAKKYEHYWFWPFMKMSRK